VASGYVWFDVMALLVAPYLLAATRRLSGGPNDDFRAAAESHRGRTTDTAREGAR
jgi:hypothetical protein